MTAQIASDTRLRGRRLLAARAVCIVLMVLGLATWSASLSPRFDELRTPCAGEQCPVLTLSPQDADALQANGVSLELYAGYQIGIEIFTALVHLLLAVLIFWRKSDDWMALFVSVTLALMGTVFFSAGYYAALKVFPEWQPLFDLLVAVSIVLLVMLLYLFPDGRFVPHWTRALIVILAVALLIGMFLPGGLYAAFMLGAATAIIEIPMLVGFAVGIVAQVYRYWRSATVAQRQQTKWVVFGLTAMVVGIFAWILVMQLAPLPPGPARVFVNLGGNGILSIVSFPIALTIAILRYHLWDIDILIRRTLIYGVLTGALAFVYFGSVLLLQSLFTAVGGRKSPSSSPPSPSPRCSILCAAVCKMQLTARFTAASTTRRRCWRSSRRPRATRRIWTS